MGRVADGGVPFSSDFMVCDVVLEPSADITRMVCLIFFVEFFVKIIVFNGLPPLGP